MLREKSRHYKMSAVIFARMKKSKNVELFIPN